MSENQIIQKMGALTVKNWSLIGAALAALLGVTIIYKKK